jgi:hypothetical protein
LFDRLPRDDFGASLHLGFETWRDLNHFSFDFLVVRPVELDAPLVIVEWGDSLLSGAHIRQNAQFGIQMFECCADVRLIFLFANIVTRHKGVGGGFFNPVRGLKQCQSRRSMNNLFFDVKIMFQKHSRCDGGVKPSKSDFKSSNADFGKVDVTNVAVEKTCNGGGGRGSVCGHDLISGREIGTGDLVFLRKIVFCRGRSDYDGMGTFGWHIGNTVEQTWKADLISSKYEGAEDVFICFYLRGVLRVVASYAVDIGLKNREGLTSLKTSELPR